MTRDRPTLAYVIGTTDCGSTLLAFVLDRHPMICALGEPPKRAIRRRGDSFVCSCGAAIPQCSFWQALFKNLAAEGVQFSDTVWPNDYHYLNDLANKILAKHQQSLPRQMAQRLLASVLPPHQRKMRTASLSSIRFVMAALSLTGKEVFLDTSKDLFRFQHLRRIDSWNLKVIRMVRDVRWFAYTKRKRLRPAEAAQQWRTYQVTADRLLRDVPRENQMLVRYEDLCNLPVETARGIHRFLDVSECDPPAEYDPATHHILGDGIAGRFTISTTEVWRTELTAHEQSVALEIAGDFNQRFGYA